MQAPGMHVHSAKSHQTDLGTSLREGFLSAFWRCTGFGTLNSSTSYSTVLSFNHLRIRQHETSNESGSFTKIEAEEDSKQDLIQTTSEKLIPNQALQCHREQEQTIRRLCQKSGVSMCMATISVDTIIFPATADTKRTQYRAPRDLFTVWVPKVNKRNLNLARNLSLMSGGLIIELRDASTSPPLLVAAEPTISSAGNTAGTEAPAGKSLSSAVLPS